MSKQIAEPASLAGQPLIKKSQYPLAAVIFLMLAYGVYGFIMTLLQGHHAWGTSDEIPWGILLSTYVFFVVSSTGLCLCCSLGSVFQIKAFETMGIRAVLMALIGLVVGFIVIAMELAHPFRLLIWAVLSPNFSSTILLMGLLYGLYMVFLLFELWFIVRGNHQVARLFATFAFFSAIVAHSNLGAVFGLLAARSAWYGPYLPIYFILSALTSGAAILSIIFYLVHRGGREDHKDLVLALGKLLALFIGITIFFTTWKVIAGIAGHVPGKYESTMLYLNGPLRYNFWVFEVLIGMVGPILIILRGGRKMGNVFLAALLTMVGIFVMRYDLVIGGQMVPVTIDHSVHTGYLSYTPSVAEWGIVIGALALVPILYVIGMRFLSFLSGKFNHQRLVFKNISHSN